jgi:two-component system cell cycle sensor histidine kinase/response regulator CckA
VLLVEDESGVRAVATRILQNAGYVVHAAESPRRAIEMVTGGLQPDVLLTDMVLPDMNGQVLAETIVQRCRDCKVVIMSGYTDTALFQPGVLPAALKFLSKPFTAASLTDTVADALDLRDVVL